jgi:hypothetical protein
LFNNVYHLGHGEDKSVADLEDYVLIDDSFTERQMWNWWSLDPVSSVPVLEALSHRMKKQEKRHPRTIALNLFNDTYVTGEPTVKDKLQLDRIREHVELARERAIDIAKPCLVLDVGPERQPCVVPERQPIDKQENKRILIETVDISDTFKPDIVGDICEYVACGKLYDLVLCTEVLEHTKNRGKLPKFCGI